MASNLMRSWAIGLIGSSLLAMPAAAGPNETISMLGRVQEALAAGDLIERHAFSTLPGYVQERLTAAGLAPGQMSVANWLLANPTPATDEQYEPVKRIVTRSVFDRMTDLHRRSLVDFVVRRAAGHEVPAMCFAPDTPEEIVQAFNTAVFGPIGVRFQLTQRWTSTATNPGPLNQGDRCTLTYSFPPDGTTCPTLTTGATLPSNLFAFLNGIYGSPDVWQAVYAQVFGRWSQVCGLTYVFEPNDDGAAIGTVPGVLGVRGDLRLSGTTLDGPSGVLAFNNFPQNGDMVIDTADTFFNVVTGNSLRIRNVLAHEHGHGMGLLHVCPSNQTKLMEPFISTAYDGPQYDDVIASQRQYGDPFEPNDTPATATLLSAATGATTTFRTASCDDRLDPDYYRLAVPGSGLLSVTVRPNGGTYVQGPQTSACNTGTAFNGAAVNDLGITLVAGNQTTVLTSLNDAAVGQPETLVWPVADAGDLYIRVGPGSTPSIQAYEIDYRFTPAPAMEVFLPTPAPVFVSPTEATPLTVRIAAAGDTVQAAQLFYRFAGSAPFVATDLVPAGANTYTALIPSPRCNGFVQYYIQVIGAASGVRSLPAGAPSGGAFAATPRSTTALFDDDFEQARGWTVGAVGDNATTGLWVRGDPVGTTFNGGQVQPEDDNTANGAQCFFTGQGAVGGAVGDADVDGGTTTLLSPIIDLSTPGPASVSYYRWYSNSRSGEVNLDTFAVDVSNDAGQSWTSLEVVGPAGAGTDGGWVRAEFDLGPRIAFTSQMQFRFIARDLAGGTLLEAALDDFAVTRTSCSIPCEADLNDDGDQTVQDLFDFLEFYFSNDSRADFNRDAQVSPQDVFDYVIAWFLPCP